MVWLRQYLRRSEDAAFRVIDGEAVIVASRTGKMFTLNRVGTFIWEQADGTVKGEEMVDQISKSFRVEPKEVLLDADDFIRSLMERGLLTATG